MNRRRTSQCHNSVDSIQTTPILTERIYPRTRHPPHHDPPMTLRIWTRHGGYHDFGWMPAKEKWLLFPASPSFLCKYDYSTRMEPSEPTVGRAQANGRVAARSCCRQAPTHPPPGYSFMFFSSPAWPGPWSSNNQPRNNPHSVKSPRCLRRNTGGRRAYGSLSGVVPWKLLIFVAVGSDTLLLSPCPNAF